MWKELPASVASHVSMHTTRIQHRRHHILRGTSREAPKDRNHDATHQTRTRDHPDEVSVVGDYE